MIYYTRGRVEKWTLFLIIIVSGKFNLLLYYDFTIELLPYKLLFPLRSIIVQIRDKTSI